MNPILQKLLLAMGHKSVAPADATDTRGAQAQGLVQQTVGQMRHFDPDSVEAAGRTMALAHQRGYDEPNWSPYNPITGFGISGPQEDQFYPPSRVPTRSPLSPRGRR